jgi:hypothetical protein
LTPKRLVDSATPFTEWVRRGAKERDWQQYLRDMDKKHVAQRDKNPWEALLKTGETVEEDVFIYNLGFQRVKWGLPRHEEKGHSCC